MESQVGFSFGISTRLKEGNFSEEGYFGFGEVSWNLDRKCNPLVLIDHLQTVG